MSVTVSKYARSKQLGYLINIRVTLPSGERIRERVKSALSTKEAAKRWGEERAIHLAQFGKAKFVPPEVVPTFEEFVKTYLVQFSKGNHDKPSTRISKLGILKNHLSPRFGSKRLDTISSGDVQALKADLADRAPKTVNNILATLSTILKAAVKQGKLSNLPTIELLKKESKEMHAYSKEEFEKLVEAGARIDWRTELLLLLGGDAGLRTGEILGLNWPDVDFVNGHLTVRRSIYRGHETSPKHGKQRVVPLTERLGKLLREHRGIAGRVLTNPSGKTVTRASLTSWMRVARRKAGMEVSSGLHVLRHTFASLLATAGVPVQTIQRLAGHSDLATTSRYMHLAPNALTDAIQKLGRVCDGAVTIMDKHESRTEAS